MTKIFAAITVLPSVHVRGRFSLTKDHISDFKKILGIAILEMDYSVQIRVKYLQCRYVLLSESGTIDFLEFKKVLHDQLQKIQVLQETSQPSQQRGMQADLESRESSDHRIQDMREQFQVFDKDRDGFISAEDLRLTMHDLGVTLTSEDVKDMLKEAGVGPRGKIYFRGRWPIDVIIYKYRYILLHGLNDFTHRS